MPSNAVLRLLDDTSPSVRGALLAYFRGTGPAAEVFLRAAAEGDSAQAEAAAWYLRELGLNDPIADFRGFIRSLNYELESGSMLLARTVSGSLDIGACCALCDEIAGRCRELLAEPCSLREKCRVLNRVVFHEFAFCTEPDDTADASHRLIDGVLEQRKGTPLALCIVYLLLAERLGMELDPVILPGRFLVGCFGSGRAFFVDPTDHGRFRTAEDVLTQMAAERSPVDPGELGPASVRELLCRNCRSLAQHYAQAGQIERAQLFAGFIREFESAQARYEA
jgi:regulator of sirC expression with transglutaminase-like and TPR domain